MGTDLERRARCGYIYIYNMHIYMHLIIAISIYKYARYAISRHFQQSSCAGKTG